MTKKSQSKKEMAGIAVLPPESTVEIKYNTDILLEKILEACVDIKKSVDELGKRFGGGY
jgi:hypothetical protein